MTTFSNPLLFPLHERQASDGIFDLTPDNPPMTALSDFFHVKDGCRWPLSGYYPGETACCGRMTSPNSPYCQTHHRRAYAKPRNYSEDHRQKLHLQGMSRGRKRRSHSETLTVLHSAEDMGL